jgi:hypothetical protein
MALLLSGQPSRETYRDSYRAWRQTDTSLERDAATGGGPIGARADLLASQAAKYGADRGAFLDEFARSSEQDLAWLATPVESGPMVAPGVGEFVTGQAAAVRRNIDTFAKDSDPGIQQVRSMLERENNALSTLAGSAAQRQKAATEADIAAGLIEESRKKVLELNREFVANLKKAADETARETTAWAAYYRDVSDGVRGADGALPTAGSALAARPNDLPVRTTPSITPLPLVRYTGDWEFGPGGIFHGPHPDSVDLTVHEDNGRCDGKFVGHFGLPPGGAGDPVLRFEFAGDFKNTRIQSFPLVTGDGAKGTIDLIPGNAFNLLEINVQIDAKPGKVRSANMVLIKK